MKKPEPVVLCILDGWGHRPPAKDNAIWQAHPPFWTKLEKDYPHALLETSGLAVGLPKGQMGNSEVGHMNIGSGRVVMQDLPRIDAAIEDGSLAKNPSLGQFIKASKESGKTCHLLGLLSPGGVHSHQNHMTALARILQEAGIKTVIHAFVDGRDSPPQSALEYINTAETQLKGTAVPIVTISGRYYAMDRDQRWERVEKAWNAIVDARGEKAASAQAAIEQAYKHNTTDEFVLPTVIGSYQGMKPGDGLIVANFRADRVRQVLHSLLDPSFNGFARKQHPSIAAALGMVEYSASLNKWLKTIFSPQALRNTLGEIMANHGLKQLRLTETEKYAHVTFFFNGGVEEEFPGEERIMVPSPKIATYDLKPEMSAPEVTEKCLAAIASNKFGMIIMNFANTDMVGHTGIQAAAQKAVEAVDTALGKIVPAIEKAGGIICITADHGNAEMIQDESTGQPHTAHTTGPVPFIIAGKDTQKLKLKNGRLCDIAPTILQLMGITPPTEMTGRSLII